MRTLCEIFVMGALIYLGWEKSFQQRIDEYRGLPKPQPQPIVRVAPTPSGRWMHDPNHRSVLDTPGPKSIIRQPQPGASGSGSWMWDPNHQSPLDPSKKQPSPH
jgi:hypothetical protein